MATTGALQKVRNGMLAVSLGAALLAGSLGVAGSAEARVPAGPRESAIALDCGWIQDQYDGAVQDYRDAKAKGDVQKMKKAQAEINKYVDAWYTNTSCGDVYGSLGLVLPSAPTNNVGHVGPTGGVSQPNPQRPSVQQIYQVGGVTPVFTQIN
jgi:hypothetical protein